MNVFFTQQRKGIRVLRRAAALVCALCAALLPFSSARAAVVSLSLGDCSDNVLRAETRLYDLDYLRGVVDGVWEEDDAAAFDRFISDFALLPANGLNLLLLGGELPKRAAVASSGVFAQNGAGGFLVSRGTLMPWDEVTTHIKVGGTYNLASCYSGIIVHVLCTYLGTYARFQPVLDWDNATLRGFFAAESSSQKQPVTVAADGISIAASLQNAPAQNGGPLPEYTVYFLGSVSGIGGIPDAEHEAIVQIAGGAQ